MKEIFRLAMRNLKEHKTKTIIIALFLIFGVAIVVMGNSFLESINRGLEKDFRANYTGDLAIAIKDPEGQIIDIFGANATTFTGEIPQIPAIPDLDKVQQIVDSMPEIKNQTKQISAQVLISKGLEMDLSALSEIEDLGFDDIPISMLFAGENDSYWETFDNITILEGRTPEPGTNEVLIDTRVLKAFNKIYKSDLHLGDTVLIMGANSNGVLREGVVCGIFKPSNENSAMFQIVYCNPELARSFANLTYGANFNQELSSATNIDVNNLSDDDLFGDDSEFDFTFEDDSVLGSSTTDFDSILGDTKLRDELNKTDDGAWNFILAKLKNPGKVKQVITELQKQFDDNGLNVQVMDWKKAAFSYSGTVKGIGMVFNILIIILAVVVFIIIMNTMTVSVIERTSEIGTMRAIGADKKFVQRLFITETVSLTLVSSIIGIILAFVGMNLFNSMNITITNSIVKMILGGGLLHFSPTPAIILVTIIIALAGSILSNIYPVKAALRITPLKALSSGD